MRDVDFMVEGNRQVSFSLGADFSDKKELGPLRFDMIYDLKYLLAYPIIDSKKPHFTNLAPCIHSTRQSNIL